VATVVWNVISSYCHYELWDLLSSHLISSTYVMKFVDDLLKVGRYL
jgi:hypothetical protein